MTSSITTINVSTLTTPQAIKEVIFTYGTTYGNTGSYNGARKSVELRKNEAELDKLIELMSALYELQPTSRILAKLGEEKTKANGETYFTGLRGIKARGFGKKKPAPWEKKPAKTAPKAETPKAPEQRTKAQNKNLVPSLEERLAQAMAVVQGLQAELEKARNTPEPVFPEMGELIAADIKQLREMAKAALLPTKGTATALRKALFAAMS